MQHGNADAAHVVTSGNGPDPTTAGTSWMQVPLSDTVHIAISPP